MNEESKSVIVDIVNEVISHTPYGMSEDVFETAFCMECNLRKISYQRQKSYTVYYKNETLTTIRPDLILYLDYDKPIVCEFKVTQNAREKRQVLKYLEVLNCHEIVLINFAKKEIKLKTKFIDADGKADLQDEDINWS